MLGEVKIVTRIARKTAYPHGTTVDVAGVPFTWTGTRFRNDDYEHAVCRAYLTKLGGFVLVAIIAFVSVTIATNLLEWETMTLCERQPYTIVGRIMAIFFLVTAGRFLIPQFPPRLFDRINQMIIDDLVSPANASQIETTRVGISDVPQVKTSACQLPRSRSRISNKLVTVIVILVSVGIFVVTAIHSAGGF